MFIDKTSRVIFLRIKVVLILNTYPMDPDIENLLTAENEHIVKLQEIVKKAIEDENLIVQNLLNPPKEIVTRGQNISDKVARFGGSWFFIISFLFLLTVWILFNVLVPKGDEFDPYPFILLNLILSCIAAIQAPVIMMSQNRQEEKDRERAKKDYKINLKSELEIRELHEKIDHLIIHYQQDLLEIQKTQIDLLENILHNVKKE